MNPIFKITPEILNLCSEITQLLGQYEGFSRQFNIPKPILRRKNRIKTIQSTLFIEGNSLSEKQVTALIENKRVLGPAKDILEVKNAIRAYENIHEYKMNSLTDLLKAHQIMMTGLTPQAGKLRSSNVCILKGQEIGHLAPKFNLVPNLVKNLFVFLKISKNLHPLIKSSIFHYELEFIHPFLDGNGRMGRLWQSVILLNHYPIFEFIPIESVIKKRQKDYYLALELCDKQGESTKFIIFMLEAIYEAVKEFFIEFKPEPQTPLNRLNSAKIFFKEKKFSRKDYIVFHKTISTATASRDLMDGIKNGLLRKIGKQALTKYCFYKK